MLLLFLAGCFGGALNAVAGGGSFLVFPALLFSGIGEVAANASTTAALWPAGVASAVAYRKDLASERGTLVPLAIASAVGGGLGGALLLVTSDKTFAVVLPWLLLLASLVFSFGPRLSKRATRKHLPLAAGCLVQLVISIYGGYFGGGMGILMLATYTLMGMRDMHAMNGLKTLLGTLINGVAVVLFFAAHEVVLTAALPALAGSIVGGFGGAALARKVPSKIVRGFVLVVAWSMTAFFFYRSTRR